MEGVTSCCQNAVPAVPALCLPCDNYCIRTIFLPCPEVVTISDNQCNLCQDPVNTHIRLQRKPTYDSWPSVIASLARSLFLGVYLCACSMIPMSMRICQQRGKSSRSRNPATLAHDTAREVLRTVAHTAVQGDPGLIWVSCRNSNRIWKYDVGASIKCINEKDWLRDPYLGYYLH